MTRCFVISHLIESCCIETKEWLGIEDSSFETIKSLPLSSLIVADLSF